MCNIDRTTSLVAPVPVPSPPGAASVRRAAPVEASSLTQGTIESALARFVRGWLRSVRAAQICFRPCLAAALQSPAPALQARYGHRSRGRCMKCCSSGVVDSCREASIYGRRRAQTCMNVKFSESRLSTPLARQWRQRAQAACRPQPSRTDGEILVAHFVLRPPPLGECHSRVERRCREW